MEDNLISTETIPEGIANADLMDESLPKEETNVVEQTAPTNTESQPGLETQTTEATEAPVETNEKKVPYHLLGIEPPDENDPFAGILESLDKPAEEYGFAENALDSSIGAVQGYLSTIQSGFTFAERAKRIAQGEDPADPNYVPEWSPFSVDFKHPIYKSIWGQVADNIAHYGTLGTATVAAGVANPMLVAGIPALVSEKSQMPDSDPMNAFRTLMPWLDDIPVLGKAVEAISVQDFDHPLMKTAKNVFQEMGLAKAFDFALNALFPNSPYQQISAAETIDVDRQIGEMAIEQANVVVYPKQIPQLPGQPDRPALPAFGAYKNKPVADIHQGNATPTGKPGTVMKQLDQMDAEDMGNGSTDPMFTRAQTRRMADNNGMTGEEMKAIFEDLISDEAYQDLVNEAYSQRKSVAEVFGPAMRRYQQIIGHDASRLPPEEFYKLILDDAPMQSGAGPSSPNITAISTENVVVTDLVVSHLFKQAQTQAKAALEIMDWGDIWATDGVMKNLRDNIVFGMGQARRARKVAAYNLLKLKQKNNPFKISSRDIDPEDFAKELDEVYSETRTNIDFFFEVIKEIDDPELNRGILEIFASSENSRNWMDLEAYMRKKVRGGDFNGKARKGQLQKELDAVWINSALSGAATPQRALIGTSEYTALRTLSRFAGAKINKYMNFGKDVDPINQAEATAQLVAGIQALPDAWQVLKRRLRNNFRKTDGKLDNRYSRYSGKDFNWKLGDKIYREMKKGTQLDRDLYELQRAAWWVNNTRLGSYPGRILNALDEPWKFIQARQRAKVKAVRETHLAVSRGEFKEVTPELLKQAEDLYMSRLLDADGNVDIFKDKFLQQAVMDDTLTAPIDGTLGDTLNQLNRPWLINRLFAFGTTWWNDIVMNVNNTPLLGTFLNRSRAIMSATEDNLLETVGKYGINNMRDLQAAKDDIIGRQFIGALVLAERIKRRMNDDANGPGDLDGKKNALMRRTGRRNNFSYFGDVGIPTNTLQTHWLMNQAVDLIFDNAYKMGKEWTDLGLIKLGAAIAASATSGSMLKDINTLSRAAMGEESAGIASVVGSQTNTQIPLGGLRNNIGNVLDPYLKELNNDLMQSIFNRNKWIPFVNLPNKSNILNGKPLNFANIYISAYNAVSAVPLDIVSDSKAIELLERSDIDLSLSIYTSPDGDDLSDYPDVRSAFEQAIGDYRQDGKSIEEILDDMYHEPEIQASLERRERESGLTAKFIAMIDGEIDTPDGPVKAKELLARDPKDYAFNRRIKLLFDAARKKAWASLQDREDVQMIQAESKKARQRQVQMNLESLNPDLSGINKINR